MDKGPWKLYKHGALLGVISDDFKHDVLLKVDGDFADDADRRAYCEWLAGVLNAACGVLGGWINNQETVMTDETSMIGRYVIVRCRDAGVHAGVLLAHSGREATLKDSRRLWYWKPAKRKKFLSGVAVAGLHAESKIGATLPLLHLTETCELILCTDEAAESIRTAREDEA